MARRCYAGHERPLREPSLRPVPPERAAPAEFMDRPLPRSPWKARRRWIIAGATATVAAILAIWFVPPPGSLTVKAADVEIALVRTAPFQDYLPVRAEVAPLR